MCGIVGILANSPVNQDIYDALTVIQHRGQDAAGMMTDDQRRVYLRKGNGLVRDVIQEPHMRLLQGNMGIGHVRYPTAGSESPQESQPFYVNSPYGLGFVHNGNLINVESLVKDLTENDLRHLNTTSDSEVLLNVLAHELQKVADVKLTTEILFKALNAVYRRVKGAFAAITMIHGFGLLAFRDPFGIRPLVIGKRETDKGTDYMVASESIALDVLGFELISDVAPGEGIFIDVKGNLHRQVCAENSQRATCIFEYIYLARPDSIIDNISVYQARLRMGEKLGEKILKEHPKHDIDVVIPIPDTSRTAALPVALKLGVTFSEGFVKNRYIGRTFIMPGQEVRRGSVRLKLNAIKEEFNGKNVLLIDDSIVRGTTSKKIIQMARDAGAKKVYFASAAPKVCYPNVYGIDMPTKEELIGSNRSNEEISQLIGADWLVYQDLTDVMTAVNAAAKTPADQIKRFEDSIFTGEYLTGGVDEHYLNYIAQIRNDAAKHKKRNGDDNLSDVSEEVTIC
jgi:amidophosphoribosyltransferase